MRSFSSSDALRLAVPAVAALSVIALVFLVWQPYALSLPEPNRTLFYRLSPALMLALPPLLCLPFVLRLQFHLRRGVAMGAMVMFGLTLAWLGYTEYTRLLPSFAQGHTWRTLAPYIDRYLMAGAVLGFVACAMAARLSVNTGKALNRVKSAAFGNADWMNMQEAARLFPVEGGIVLGERYRVDLDITGQTSFDPRDPRTWGTGGKAPLLGFDGGLGSGHTLYFAGSGGFKTTSVVLPTALSWSGPLVCLDPSVEVAPMVRTHRESTLKRRVFVLDPDGETGFNVLDWIATSKTPEQDIATVAHWLMAEKPKSSSGSDEYFQGQTHNLLTGLLAHVMFSPDYEGARTLQTLRDITSKPEDFLREHLRLIMEESASPFVRETLGVFVSMADQTFSGVHSSAVKDTQWLSFAPYAALVSGESFASKDIAGGGIDVFLNLKTEILQTYPGIARVIVGALINAMMQADGAHAARTLFLLDEVNLLGAMSTLEIARDVGRKYGVALALIYQSIGQMKKHFGPEGKAAFFDSAAFVSFAAVGDLDAAREISALCGDITVEVESTSRGLGLNREVARRTRTISHQKRPLIMPHEIVQDMRADEQIVLIKGRPPLRCGRALYFRRSDMRGLVEDNRFHRG